MKRKRDLDMLELVQYIEENNLLPLLREEKISLIGYDQEQLNDIINTFKEEEPTSYESIWR
jgi:Bacillus competence pheromone ComX.